MTGEQKQKIQTLRIQGNSYLQIADSLGLSINTVKSYCRINNLSNSDAFKDTGNEENKEHCKQCGKKLVSANKSKPKQFCSDKCRMAWWNAHPEAVKRKAVYKFSCHTCGMDFESYGNSSRKYCSRTCFGAARRGAS